MVAALFTGVAAALISRALRRERILSDLKSAFIARVSHDLRTPVASILLMAENLQEGRVGADSAPRYHGLIRSEALRLRRMVDDVLDFSRLERGRAPDLHREDVDLAHFVDDLVTAATEVIERVWEFIRSRSTGPAETPGSSTPAPASAPAKSPATAARRLPSPRSASPAPAPARSPAAVSAPGRGVQQAS